MPIFSSIYRVFLALFLFAVLILSITVSCQRKNIHRLIEKQDEMIVEIGRMQDEIKKTEMQLKFIEEQRKKDNIATTALIQKLETAKHEHTNRIDAINDADKQENASELLDWLDDAVPDYFSELFSTKASNKD